jgi:glucose/arabinose dehydrogenase
MPADNRKRIGFCLGFVLLLGCTAGGASARGTAEPRQASKPPFALKRVVRRLRQPLYVASAPGEPDRLYVVLRPGTVRVLERGRLRPGFFLDLRRRVQSFGEMGLLSIAFHPNYASNGLVYAVFNDEGEEMPVTVAEYHVRDRQVDATTERVLVRVPHSDSPYHNGGQLQFGPDGKLYVSVGDGGYLREGGRLTPDPHENAQNLGVLLGKIFRLDVGARTPAPETVAYGLRNPWRFSFAPDGNMLIGDVGWNRAEELDVLPAGAGLVNFGWSVYEGRARRPNAGPLNTAGRLVGPTLTYPTGKKGNCSITGGYLYRGRVPRLRNRYVFGDYCSGRIWSVRFTDGRASGRRLEPVRLPGLASFGEDLTGELYAVSLRGGVYRFARR